MQIAVVEVTLKNCLFLGYCFFRSLFLRLFDEILRGMFEAENEVGYCTRFREI